MELPVFELKIDEKEDSELRVDAIALVDYPAIERNFLAFKDKVKFAVQEDKRIISGPAMIAGLPIYRRDESGEHYVIFTKETIFQIVQKFLANKFTKSVNLFHDPNLKTEDVILFESFISDESRGIQPMKGFEDLADGTWFTSYKVNSDEIWERIKSGEFRGFSIEGFFEYSQKPVSTKDSYKKIIDQLNDEEKVEVIEYILRSV